MAQGLYDNGYIVVYNEGDQSIHRDFLDFVGGVEDIYHTIREDETLYVIARTYYNSSSSWYIIADANPEIIDDVFDLTVGEVILIPRQVLVT